MAVCPPWRGWVRVARAGDAFGAGNGSSDGAPSGSCEPAGTRRGVENMFYPAPE